MNSKNLQETKPDEAVNNIKQVSNTQSSAEKLKNNIPQSNLTAVENKLVSKQEQGEDSTISSDQIKVVAPDVLIDDTAQIFAWLESVNQTPRQLKTLLDTLDTRIELVEEILVKQSQQAKRIPGVDKRIESLELFDEQIESSDRHLSELSKIKLQTELTNLREKRFEVWQKFVKVCGSEKKALRYQHLRAKAKSKLYHNTSGYFVKQRIRKILNTIITKDQPALVEVKRLADDTTTDGVKLFNEKVRDLLDVYDEDLVILCSHVKREFYFKIILLTLLKWIPETDLEITELVIPSES